MTDLINNPSNPLRTRQCIPCRGGIPPMSVEEIKEYLRQVKDWEVFEDKKIFKNFQFKDFKEAMEFVNKVADIAEREGHHPDISIHYNKVEITLWTYKIGGLHENDFILASKIDNL